MPSTTRHPKAAKKSSFRSLFTIFRISGHSDKERCNLNLKGQAASSYSTASLPAHPTASESYRLRSGSLSQHVTLSTTSLPAQIHPPFSHTPSSSSSSASSFEFGSEVSTPTITPTTTPSNSSLSILIKASDSNLANPSVTCRDVGVQNNYLSNKSKRNSDSYIKSPSPLSTVTDAPYVLPTPTEVPLESPQPKALQSKRRNSISRLLTRRSQSTPDLTHWPEIIPPIPAIPKSAPSSRPTSSQSNYSRNSSTLRRKTSTDINKTTAHTIQQQIEHRSILGADPAGLGFYLYPKSELENAKKPGRSDARLPGARNNCKFEDVGQTSCSDINRNSMSSSKKSWREPRGRYFRPNVASQIIVEESNDTCESTVENKPRDSQSAIQWQQHRVNTNSVPINYSRPSSLPSIEKIRSDQIISQTSPGSPTSYDSGKIEPDKGTVSHEFQKGGEKIVVDRNVNYSELGKHIEKLGGKELPVIKVELVDV
ncbi:hypothetical protein EDC01DRAFT_170559 [Geopyxis carbonaria]|nr:hypothetical protein EDC01DRAFT_170559 [Geopyxis carbonaria]